VKLIAGKIIPALATTTTTTVGALGFEIYKIFLVLFLDLKTWAEKLKEKNASDFQNVFGDLGTPMLVLSKVDPCLLNKGETHDELSKETKRYVPEGKIMLFCFFEESRMDWVGQNSSSGAFDVKKNHWLF